MKLNPLLEDRIILESDASKIAHRMGLKYAGYGAWVNKMGTKVARTTGGRLEFVDDEYKKASKSYYSTDSSNVNIFKKPSVPEVEPAIFELDKSIRASEVLRQAEERYGADALRDTEQGTTWVYGTDATLYKVVLADNRGLNAIGSGYGKSFISDSKKQAKEWREKLDIEVATKLNYAQSLLLDKRRWYGIPVEGRKRATKFINESVQDNIPKVETELPLVRIEVVPAESVVSTLSKFKLGKSTPLPAMDADAVNLPLRELSTWEYPEDGVPIVLSILPKKGKVNGIHCHNYDAVAKPKITKNDKKRLELINIQGIEEAIPSLTMGSMPPTVGKVILPEQSYVVEAIRKVLIADELDTRLAIVIYLT